MVDVSSVIADYFSRLGKEIPAGGTFGSVRYIDDGWVDSLSMLDFVTFLEKEFSIRISDDELASDEFATLAGVVATVSRHFRGS